MRCLVLLLACLAAVPARASLEPAAVWARTAIPDCLVDVQTVPDPAHPVMHVHVTPRDPLVEHAIERTSSPCEPFVEISRIPAGQTSIVDRRIEPTVAYQYRAVAIRGTQRSLPSPSIEVDLPRILDALRTKDSPRQPRKKEPDAPSDADGTAALLVVLALWSSLRRR
jgi:hypothetical protein